jgi:hypothetical protein
MYLGIAACATPGPESAEPVAKNNDTVINGNSVMSATHAQVLDELQQAETVTAAAVRSERVCRFYTPTGSHRRERICRTRSEIAKTADESQKMLRDMDLRTMRPQGAPNSN